MSRKTVINDILSGVHDQDLDRIESTIKTRREIVGRLIAVGDRVKIQDNIRPKYIAGLFGTVVGFGRGQNLRVKLDTPQAARYYAGFNGEIQISGTYLVKV